MHRIAVIAFATLAGIVTAGAQDILKPSPTYPLSGGVPPAQEGIANLKRVAAAAAKHVILNEPGGRLDFHEEKFKEWAREGGEVEVRGLCQSACTLVIGTVPRDRICFSATGFLGFHKAVTLDFKPSIFYTQWMMNIYPRDIYDWIIAKGGIEKMPSWPSQTYWILHAEELWKMGYRKCD